MSADKSLFAFCDSPFECHQVVLVDCNRCLAAAVVSLKKNCDGFANGTWYMSKGRVHATIVAWMCSVRPSLPTDSPLGTSFLRRSPPKAMQCLGSDWAYDETADLDMVGAQKHGPHAELLSLCAGIQCTGLAEDSNQLMTMLTMLRILRILRMTRLMRAVRFMNIFRTLAASLLQGHGLQMLTSQACADTKVSYASWFNLFLAASFRSFGALCACG